MPRRMVWYVINMRSFEFVKGFGRYVTIMRSFEFVEGFGQQHCLGKATRMSSLVMFQSRNTIESHNVV